MLFMKKYRDLPFTDHYRHLEVLKDSIRAFVRHILNGGMDMLDDCESESESESESDSEPESESESEPAPEPEPKPERKPSHERIAFPPVRPRTMAQDNPQYQILQAQLSKK